jgi:tetratricopeptide (TPR) repeat protein
VIQAQAFRVRSGKVTALALAMVCIVGSSVTLADSATGAKYLKDAQLLYQQGNYFKAARYAFAAVDEDPRSQTEAYSWITISLSQAGLHNSAAYFFIRTLQSGNDAAIRRVLGRTQELLLNVGPDLLRQYLLRHTRIEQYDTQNRNALLYAQGKDALLQGETQKAISFLSGIPRGSALRPYALQLRAAALALDGKAEQASQDYEECANRADDMIRGSGSDPVQVKKRRREAWDLEARCRAGYARTLYELGQFEEADRAYDQISKRSLVWPDILFEQAWNSFARQEYNRSLGKLVTYKSPALAFVYNSEVDVLRAQSFLALCLYNEANGVVNEFNTKYTKLGEEVKRFVEGRSTDLGAFYELGRQALRAPLYTKSEMNRLLNRFVRGPYFQSLVAAEKEVSDESAAITRFASMQAGAKNDPGAGFPGFLNQVLRWRAKSIRLLGGVHVKNSMIDYHMALISDFEKMAFIKLEMLKRAKDKLVFKRPSALERGWGNVTPSRRDDQQYWSFNGEFWNDELGDYVFGLESECNAENRS